MEGMAQASARVPFRLKVAIVWAVIFLFLGFLFNAADFDTEFMRDRADYVVKGLVYTLLIAFFAIILAIILALIGALGRLSRNPIAYGVSGFYTSFFRGTPLIVQLFLIAFALPDRRGEPGPAELARRPAHAGLAGRGDPGAGAQLRRVHDGDLPRGHPVGQPRPVRGRRGARHDLPDRR